MRPMWIGLAGALCLVFAVACGGGDDDTPDPTGATGVETPEASATTEVPDETPVAETPGAETPAPAESPTPAPTAEVSPEFRAFAPQIADAVANKDLDFFLEHAWTDPHRCTARDVEITGFFKACDTEGQEFQGLGLSVWHLEGGGLVPAERIFALLNTLWETPITEGQDDFGGPQAQLYALGTNPRLDYHAELAVITALIPRPSGMEGTGPLRVALVTHWRFEEDDWRLFEVMQAPQLAEELLEPTDAGRAYINAWERYEQ